MITNLYFMVGIAGSGKSTRAKQILQEHLDAGKECVLLSSDALREELLGDASDQSNNALIFETMRKRLKENIYQRDVILDATNVTRKDRATFFSCLNQDKVEWINIVAVVMTTPYEKCKEWNLCRERSVPEYVQEKQLRRFQIPFFEEGFDEILLETDQYENSYDADDRLVSRSYRMDEDACKETNWATDDDPLFKEMRGFDQKTQWHMYTLGTHCKAVADLIKYDRPNDRVLYRAALLHDYGKMFTQMPKPSDPKQMCYYNHENVGTYKLLTEKLNLIGLDNEDDLLRFLFLVNYHMEPFKWHQEKTFRKYSKIYGSQYPTLMFFNVCDKIGSGRKDYKWADETP